MKKIKVKIPATTSNLGPGFDVIGAALNLYNTIEVVLDNKRPKKNQPEIIVRGEGKDVLPCDKSNLVWKAMEKVFKKNRKNINPGSLKIKLTNNIPLCSGLGSSAAAWLGGLIAAYRIIGKKSCDEDLLSLGVEYEGHPDNIVPALVGGLCVCADNNKKIVYVKHNASIDLAAVVCVPKFELPTHKARKILPKMISRKHAVSNLQNCSVLVSAINHKRYDLLKNVSEDFLHQNHRAKLVPYMKEVFEAAMKSGAYMAALSGAGPSIIALCDKKNKSRANKIANSMKHVWMNKSIQSKCFVLNFVNKGVC